jgi:hypothetical protein
VSGVLTLLGAAMIVPLFIPARWRGARKQDGGDEDTADSALAATGLLAAPAAVPAAGQADLSGPR